jgi:radical SAM protein with 4Fe4S-binding SPASM domain
MNNLFKVVEVETITACNLRCSYCPNSIYDRGLIRNKKLMKTSVYHKLIDELAELNFRGNLHPHFYGEPLLDKRLPSLITYTRKKLPSVNIQVFTNGKLLTLDSFKELVKKGVNKFVITQHLPTMTDNLKKVISYYKERYVKKNKKKIKIIYGKIESGTFLLNDGKIERKFSLFNRGGIIKLNHVTHKKKTCNWPSIFLTIDYKGNVVLCCNDYHSSIKFGNIEKERLIDIWNKPYFKQLRDKLGQNTNVFPFCRKCKLGYYIN